MRLTKRQRYNLAKRYWAGCGSFPEAKARQGFGRLRYSQFADSLREFPELIPIIKKEKTRFKLHFENKTDSTPGFMAMTEDEQIKFREGVPIPAETMRLFEIGRGAGL